MVRVPFNMARELVNMVRVPFNMVCDLINTGHGLFNLACALINIVRCSITVARRSITMARRSITVAQRCRRGEVFAPNDQCTLSMTATVTPLPTLISPPALPRRPTWSSRLALPSRPTLRAITRERSYALGLHCHRCPRCHHRPRCGRSQGSPLRTGFALSSRPTLPSPPTLGRSRGSPEHGGFALPSSPTLPTPPHIVRAHCKLHARKCLVSPSKQYIIARKATISGTITLAYSSMPCSERPGTLRHGYPYTNTGIEYRLSADA